MTMIDVDTSPLQAAREWRGIGLVAAAVNSGLPMAQAEALEDGDPSAFGSIDEMIAAAVVYGATIGIGRDEAMALLDRTVCGTGAQVQLPADSQLRPNEDFSGAVHERSARIVEREVISEPIIEEPPSLTALDVDMPSVPLGPSPEQAVAASGELHLDTSFGPEAPWERGNSGELAAWVDDFDDGVRESVETAPHHGHGFGARLGDSTQVVLERIIGTERADAAGDWVVRTSERLGELTRAGRERLRRSEHATLFVAIGGGAILIAILVALGGALGSDSPTGPGRPAAKQDVVATPATGTSATTETATSDATKTEDSATTETKPMFAPARLTLDIFNAGTKKGYAKEVAADLRAAGYKIGEVTNSKGRYTGASIIYPSDMEREAKLIAKRIGITTLQEAPGSTRKITIVVT